jgi:hypothetical protein
MPHPTDPYHNLALSLVFLFIVAGFTSYYASRKGRNPVIWFIWGALLGIFAPLILLFLSNLKTEGTQNVERPTMAMSRPDPALQHLATPPPTPAELKRQQEEDKLWYYLDLNHQQEGPVSVVALRELWNTGRLELTSYVWSEGMTQWDRVDNLPELKAILNKTTV